jgi:hypothetical protein
MVFVSNKPIDIKDYNGFVNIFRINLPSGDLSNMLKVFGID